MGLEVVSYGTNSMWCREMMAKYRDNMMVQSGVDALLSLDVEHAYMEFDDHQHRCRPYMMLMGRPRSLDAVDNSFPFGVTTINFVKDEDMAPVVYRYDLTRSNLTEMARKGLYEADFEVPPIIQGNRFVLPCKVSLAGMPSAHPDREPPVLFASVDRSSLRCTDVTSGYQIDEYFREVPLSKEEQEFEERRQETAGLNLEQYQPDEFYQELFSRGDLQGMVELLEQDGEAQPGEQPAVGTEQTRSGYVPKSVSPYNPPKSDTGMEQGSELEEESDFI